MKITEIELYDENAVEEIVSHLGYRDKCILEKIIKDLTEIIALKESQIRNLQERIEDSIPKLDRILTMLKWDIDYNRNIEVYDGIKKHIKPKTDLETSVIMFGESVYDETREE